MIKYWVAETIVEQLSLEGKAMHVLVSVGNVHLVKNEILMCKGVREVICRELKAKKKGKVATSRPKNVPLCPDCEEAYKTSPDSAWSKWSNGVAISGGKTPVMR